MKGFVANIEQLALKNDYFRQVLYTAKNCQLVVMSLNAGEDIGEEVHQLDQFIKVERGEGKAVLGGAPHPLAGGSAVVIPAGVRHNIINTGPGPMKLYTVYAPPNHKDGTTHKTKAEAEANEEHFDGKTTE
jgi:mannose-6-phosphate isomerase-like protein (cupin superfamily)